MQWLACFSVLILASILSGSALASCPDGYTQISDSICSGPVQQGRTGLESFFHWPIIGLVPGLAGGVVAFLYALASNKYENGMYVKKFTIETVGATLTAVFLSLIFADVKKEYAIVMAFLIGLGWSNLVQHLRIAISSRVQSALGPSNDKG